MGNSNKKEITLKGLGHNISNMSFNLNNDSILISFYSNVINKIFTDSISKTTNLNFFYPNSILNDINNSQLKQQIKFSQMIGDLLDKDIQSNMNNKYTSEEESIFNNIINNQNNQNNQKLDSFIVYKKKTNINNKKNSNNIENIFNNSINNISSIHGSSKDSKYESEIEFSQISVNTLKPSFYSNQNKQDKMHQTGKKKDFQISNSQEKLNNNLIKKNSQNNSFDYELNNYLIPENELNNYLIPDNDNKNQIINPNQIYKKSMCQSQENKILQNSFQINEQSKNINSYEKNEFINKNYAMNENINNTQNLILSPLKNTNNDINKCINVPKNINENYLNNQKITKTKQNNNSIELNSYVEIMKMKKRHLDKRKNFLIKDNFNNTNTFNRTKLKKSNDKSKNSSFDNINKNIEINKYEIKGQKSFTPLKKEINCLKEKFNLNLFENISKKDKMNDNTEIINEKKNELKQNSNAKKMEKHQLNYYEKNELKKKNINNKIKSFHSFHSNISKNSNIKKPNKEKLKNNNNKTIEENQINKNYLTKESFNISQDSQDETEDKNKNNVPMNVLPNLSDNPNFTSKFNTNPQNQISYSMINYTSFGNFKINTFNNNENTNNNNINSDINNYINTNFNLNNKEENIKNNINVNNILYNNKESENKNQTTNFHERISNSLNDYASENQFQSNTLRELFANYNERKGKIKNDNFNDLGIINEENNFEKSIHQNNISLLSKNSKNNSNYNNPYINENNNYNKLNDDDKKEFQITSKIRESEFNDIDF